MVYVKSEGKWVESKPNCSIHCRCGAVHVEFSTPTPRYALLCACVDCYAKNEWSYEKQGTPMPNGLCYNESKSIYPERPNRICYFDNAMKINDKSKLSFNKIRTGAMSTNCIATCCSTILFVDHPMYQQHQVLVFPEFVQNINVYPLPPPLFLVFAKDWPVKGKPLDLPNDLPQAWMDHKLGNFTGTTGWAAAFSQAGANVQLPPVQNHGDTFQQLFEHAGGEAAMEILQLPEASRSAKFL